MKAKPFIIIVLMIVLIDQVSKYIISSKMVLGSNIEVIPNFFSLYYTHNNGAAFSILQGHIFLFYIVSVIGLGILLYIYKQATGNVTRIAVAFVIGGLIGNLIDRIIYQKVIDFLSFTFASYDFAIFNLADTFITVGVIILLVDVLFLERRRAKRRGIK